MEVIKRIISTPNVVLTTAILGYGFFIGKVNGIVALLTIGMLVLFAVLKVGNKQLWK